MLTIFPNTYALVVSTENLTYNWYPGTNRGMLVTNTIFRVGGAALLLSNKRSDSWCAPRGPGGGWVGGWACIGVGVWPWVPASSGAASRLEAHASI